MHLGKGAALAGAAAAIIAGLAVFRLVETHETNVRLLAADADTVAHDPVLVAYARALAAPAYAENCAACHGADRKGRTESGAPSLTGPNWLYDFGRASDIEKTILYGIRSGDGRARNITDMPGFGVSKKLSPAEIGDVVGYVASLSRSDIDPARAARGHAIFEDKGSCYDCHGTDATGNPDYGSPSFVAPPWLYGGDEAAIYRSVYDGRHGLCPAWIGRLSFAQIRALAVTLAVDAAPQREKKP